MLSSVTRIIEDNQNHAVPVKKILLLDTHACSQACSTLIELNKNQPYTFDWRQESPK